MTRIIEYTDDNRLAWSEYVARASDSTIAHRIGWRDVIHKSLGHSPKYLMAMSGSTVKGVLPLFVVTTWWRAKYVVSVPWLDYGGVCADDKETEKLLLSEATRITDDKGARFLELRSVESNEVGLEKRLDKVSFLLELDNDPDKVWKAFGWEVRGRIKKSRKSGLTTEIGGLEKLDDFYGVFSHNMRDLGTPVWSKELFRNTLTEFPEDAEIILVRMNDAVIGCGLILSFKKTQYVPSASSFRWSLKYCPNNALYWCVIERACQNGYECFDFGRSSWDSGTFRFKKKWGAPVKQLEWQYYLNKEKEVPRISPDNPKYKTAIKLWKKMPLWLANFLGPKVIKNFP